MRKPLDIIVIGGGPAGMIAAGTAASSGASVLLLEKNEKLGKKLLLTGKERCNITNAEINSHSLKKIYGENGSFLHSAFNAFSNHDIIEFFEHRGVKTKVERGNRVFPQSDRALDVLSALTKYLTENNVKVKFRAEVNSFVRKNRLITKVVLANSKEYTADKFIIATGGKSYPETGSTGDAFSWLADMGHQVIKPAPALVPIVMFDNFIKDLEGLSLRNVKITLFDNNTKIDARFGEALFTAHGMSGPVILDLSKLVTGLIKPTLNIDLKPALNYQQLDLRIQRDFAKFNNKIFRNSLHQLLPRKLIAVIIKLSGIDPEKYVNAITKSERKKLLNLLKEFKLIIKGVDGFRKAIITSGGVSLKEVNPKTMRSKLIDNLYFAGEILDLDGPTGGFNLQICWSSGYCAGLSSAN